MSGARASASGADPAGEPRRGGLGPGWWIAVAVLAVAAAVLRITVLAGKDVVGTDEARYLLIGGGFWRGDGYSFLGAPELQYPPVAPLLGGGLGRLLGDLPRGLDVLSVLAGAGAVVAGAWAGRRLYGPAAGIGAALVVGASPALVAWTPYWGSLTEAPVAALTLWALGATAGVLAGRLRAGAALGVAAGLATLTRPESLGLLAGALVLLAVVVAAPSVAPVGDGPAPDRRRLLGAGAVAVVVAAAVIAPYSAYLAAETGSFRLTGKGDAALGLSTLVTGAPLDYERAGGTLDPSGTRIVPAPELAAAEQLSTAGRLRAYADHFARNAPDAARDALRAPFVPWWLAAFGLLGLVAAARGPGRRRLLAAVPLAGLVPLAIVACFFVLPRYLTVAVPVAALLAGHGLAVAGRWLARPAGAAGGAREAVATVAPAAVVALALAAIGLRDARVISPAQPVEYAIAGRWLADHARPGARFTARKPEIALYADRPIVALPVTDPEGLRRYMAANGVRYVVLAEATQALRPALAPLWTERRVPGFKRLLAQGPPGHRAVIWQLAPVRRDRG